MSNQKAIKRKQESDFLSHLDETLIPENGEKISVKKFF